MRAFWIVPAFLLSAGSAGAQTQPPPCEGAEFRQMDFWLGTWVVKWEASPGSPAGEGANVVTKVLGGCVVEENFDGGPATANMIGNSVSIFHKPLGLWRQTWVDNQGGYFDLTGGPDGENRFVLTNVRLSDKAPHLRMVFEDIEPDSLIWRWQGSTDGENWTDRWVISYARKN